LRTDFHKFKTARDHYPKGGPGLTGSLDILKDAERRARQTLEEAARKASAIRAGIPAEVDALRKDSAGRLGQERREAEEAVRGQIASVRRERLEEAARQVEVIEGRREEAAALAFEILSEIAGGKARS
jgi:hypothetical protein